MNIVQPEFIKQNSRFTYSFLLGSGLVVALLAGRMYLTHSGYYLFLIWNLFLAFVPFCISNFLTKRKGLTFTGWVLGLAAWLLFFPQCSLYYYRSDTYQAAGWHSYLVRCSDGFLRCTNGVVDCLYFTFANGKNLEDDMAKIHAGYFIAAVLVLSGFGIYLGRVLRYNSWDVVTDPFELLKVIAVRVFNPLDYLRTWGVTFLFAAMIWVAYVQVKMLVRNREI